MENNAILHSVWVLVQTKFPLLPSEIVVAKCSKCSNVCCACRAHSPMRFMIWHDSTRDAHYITLCAPYAAHFRWYSFCITALACPIFRMYFRARAACAQSMPPHQFGRKFIENEFAPKCGKTTTSTTAVFGMAKNRRCLMSDNEHETLISRSHECT